VEEGQQGQGLQLDARLSKDTSVVGTFRTRRAVRLESVMRVKADIGEMNIAACSSKSRSIAAGRWLRRARPREPVSRAGRTAPPAHRKFSFLGLFLFGVRVLSVFNPKCPKLNLAVS
jgi:hypothetical protein